MIAELLHRVTGVKGTPIINSDREQLVAIGKAHYHELVDQGFVYGGQTGVAGVAPGTALGTTGASTLFNPPNSNVKLVVLKTSIGYISGTLGAGVVVYAVNVNPVAAVVTGTAIVVVNLKLGSAATDRGNRAQLFTTSTLPATPTALRPVWTLDAALATSVVGIRQLVDNVDGEIQLLPNTAVTLHGVAAAGTTPLVVFGWIWAEVPL